MLRRQAKQEKSYTKKKKKNHNLEVPQQNCAVLSLGQLWLDFPGVFGSTKTPPEARAEMWLSLGHAVLVKIPDPAGLLPARAVISALECARGGRERQKFSQRGIGSQGEFASRSRGSGED